ncbi:MAG: (d)CMP kinase [Phycisphaerae bacterium]
MIITIDGPAGSGKSTVARKVAARLGIPYLDTGAMYRVVTLAALEDGVDLTDDDALTRLAAGDEYRLDLGPTHIRVTLRGHDVTEEIRGTRVSDHARYIAASPGVRRVLVEKQRKIGQRLGTMVTEGRDQGSVAFPDADARFFMDAAPEKRAERRYHELIADGEDVTYEDVLQKVIDRDRTDAERAVAPMVVPEGAIFIDSTHHSIHEVVDQIVRHLVDRGLVDPQTLAAGRDSHAAL